MSNITFIVFSMLCATFIHDASAASKSSPGKMFMLQWDKLQPPGFGNTWFLQSRFIRDQFKDCDKNKKCIQRMLEEAHLAMETLKKHPDSNDYFTKRLRDSICGGYATYDNDSRGFRNCQPAFKNFCKDLVDNFDVQNCIKKLEGK